MAGVAQRYNVSLDSPSPLLSYSPAALWRPMKPADDGLSALYANGSTAAVTGFAGIGGKLTFTFNGTGVWIFGAKRDNHGYYNVTLDSNPVQTFNGLGDPNAFQQLLYSATDLDNTHHNVTVVNVGPFLNNNTESRVWLDIDWVTYEQVFKPPLSSNSSNPSIVVTTYTVNENISYTPSTSEWPSSSFIDSSGSTVITRTTQNDQASATLNFTLPSTAGTGAVGIFGPLNETHGNYLVSLSEISPNSSTIVPNQGYSGLYNFDIIHEQMLFYQGGLTPGGLYSLKVMNAPSGPSTNYFGLEYIRTWSVGAGTTAAAPLPPSSTNKSSGSSSHTGLIAGVVAGVLGLAIFTGLLVFLLRKRRKQNLAKGGAAGQNLALPFIIDGDMSEPPLPRPRTMEGIATNHRPNHHEAFPLPQLQPLSGHGATTATSTHYQQSTFTDYGQQPAFLPSVANPSTQSVTGTASASGGGNSNGSGYDTHSRVLTGTPASSASPQSQQLGTGGTSFPRDRRVKHIYQPSDSSAAPSVPQSVPRLSAPSPIPQQTLSPHRAPLPAASSDVNLQVRYERDAGPLGASTPVEEDLVMPPEYEDARQPWERQRE